MAKAKTTTTARASTKRREPAVPIKAARAALDQSTKAIKRLQKDSARNFWAIGRRLVQIAELDLHRARGFNSVATYAEEVLDLSRSTAFQYMRVAEAFSEEVAATFGAEKLNRGLAYIAATPADEEPRDLPGLRIPVPADDGGQPRPMRFSDVTTRELRRAIDATKPRKRARAIPAGVPEKTATALTRAEKALDAAVGRKAAASARISARLADDGRVILDIRGVELAQAGKALRAVAAALK